MNDHPVHTAPNHHPPKVDVLQNKFLQIILPANWLVRHLRMSLKKLRRPLPLCLSESFSMVLTVPGVVETAAV